MNDMFLTNDDHSQFLVDCVADSPKSVTIASFGLYIGITYQGQDTTTWGQKYRLATRDLLESMRSLPNVRLLIGVGDYQGCKGRTRCLDCEQKYVKTLIRLVNQAELFPEFDWRLTTELHLKCILFGYDEERPRGVAGGRNFTDSSWADVTFALNELQIGTLKEYVDKLWDTTGEMINDEVVANIMRLQQIPPDSLNSLFEEEECY